MTDMIDVYSDLPQEMLNEVMVETYRKWVMFALGKKTLNGRKLKHPSGRYAESIRVENQPGNVVAVFSDSPIADVIEKGHKTFNLRDKMLQSGKAKTTKDGSRYRYIPIASYGKNSFTEPQGTAYLTRLLGAGVDGKGIKQLWGKMYKKEGPIRVMSSKQGPSAWQIPAMVAYSPAQIFADLLQKKYGRRI